MGCCLAAALIFSLARRGWWFVTGQEPPSEPFPPAARRLAPGQVVPPVPAAEPEARPLVSAPVALALTTALYVVVATLLGAESTLPRDLSLAALLLVALVLATRFRPRHREAAAALAVSGALWSALALVDMHVFGLESSTPTDVVVHGVGLLALYVGLALWQPLRRPAPLREGLMS